MEAVKQQRDKLNDKYTQEMEIQRKYYKAVREFQEECRKNEELLATAG